MKKRILSLLLVVVMVLGMLPVNALAATDDTWTKITEASTEPEGTYAAYIGEQGYDSLEAAVKAAGAEAIITLADGTHTLSGTVANKNITITGSKDAVVEMLTAVNASGSTVNFNGVTVKFDNDNYEGLQHSAKVTYTNCTHIGTEFLYAPVVSYTGCTFEMYDAATEYAVWTYGAEDVTFTDCEFNTNGKAILVYTEAAHQADIGLSDCQFISNGTFTGKAAVELGQSANGNVGTYNVTFDEKCTADENFSANNSTSNLWGNKDAMTTESGSSVVIADGENQMPAPAPAYAAYIGEQGYDSLEAAVKAAVAEATITLSAGTHVFPNSGIYAGKKLTFQGGEGVIIDATALGNEVYGDEITFNNVTMNFPGTSHKGITHTNKVVFNNCTLTGTQTLYAADVDFNSCTFVVTGDNYAVWTYGAKDVTFTYCTFNTDGKAVLVYTEGAHTAAINVSECDFNATTNRGKAAIELGQSANGAEASYTVVIDKSTADDNFVANKTDSNLWGNKNDMTTGSGENGSSVTVDNVQVMPAPAPVWNSETIANVDDLIAFAEAVNGGNSFAGKTVTLTADIKLTGSAWSGIGIYKGVAFQGTFNGAGHKITNVTFADASNGNAASEANNYRGFFNHIKGAVVKDLTVSGSVWGTAPASTEYGGALIVGHANASTIENCVAEGTVNGTHNVAGVVVRVQDSNIIGCTNKADLTGSYSKLGGIAAMVQNSETAVLFDSCVNEGTITSTARGEDGVGGIVGWIGYPNTANITVKNCENKGAITAQDTATVGQIAAESWNGNHVFEGNKGLPSMIATGHAAMSGMNYAIVTDGVAAYTKELAAGNTYLVTAPNPKPVIKLAAGESISFDTSLAAIDDSGITTDAELVITTEGKVSTYKAVAYVAQIGQTGYESLQAAIDNAAANDTVTLLADIHVNDEAKTSGYYFTVGPDKDITLALNGHSISGTINGTANCGLIDVQGKLNVTGNGTIQLTNTDNSNAWSFSSAVIGLNNHNGSTVDTTLTLGEGVTVKHNGGTAMAYAVDMMTYTGCEVVINGAALDSSYTAVRIFGNNGAKKLTVNSGSITGTSRGVWAQHNGQADVDLTVNDGTVSSIRVSTEGGSTGGDMDVALNGGTVNALTLSLNGNAVTAPTVTKAAEVSLAAPDGYKWDENGTLAELNYVAEVNGEKFETLEAAIAAANTGDTVTLLTDVAELGTEVEAGSGEFFVQILDKEVTVDLNGKTFTGSFYLNSGAKLTVDNGSIVSLEGNKSSCIESVGGSIVLGEKLTATSNARHTIRVKGGTAVINGGTYTNNSPLSGSYYALNVSHAANVTLNGGKFVGNGGEQGAFIVQDNASVVNINDCNIANGDAIVMQIAAGTTISGGTYAKWTGGYNGYLAAGKVAVQNADGLYEVVDAVAKIGDKVYGSLTDAIAAANTGDEITLLTDVAELGTEVEAGSGEYFVQILDKEVTIDLGGYTFTGSFYLNSGAKLTVDNGSIVTHQGNASSAIESVGGSIVLGDKLSVHSSVRHAIRVKGGEAVINGGTYTADGNSTYHAVNVSHAAKVTINGGDFISNKGNSTSGGNALMIQDSASTVNVYGGKFSNASGVEGCICAAAGLNIYGGTFDTWTYDNYLAAGKVAVQNADGLYEVVDAVAKIGDKVYGSLTDAITAANEGDIITVLAAEIELPVITKAGLIFKTEVGTKITNSFSTNSDSGWRLTGTTFDGFEFTKQAGFIATDLTIKNSKFTGGNGIYYGAASGTWTIENCEFNCTTYNLQFGSDATGTVNVNDCVFYGGFNTFGSTVTMNFDGCTFNKSVKGNYNVVQTYGNMTVKNSTIAADWPTGAQGGTFGSVAANAVTEIYSTTYAGEGSILDLSEDKSVGVMVLDPEKDESGKYTAGTFAAEPAADLLAPDYVPVQHADGTYGITPVDAPEGAEIVTIGSAADFDAFAAAVNGQTTYQGYNASWNEKLYVVITADIDMSQVTFTTAIGSYGNGGGFSGTLDGQGHTLSNYTVSGNWNYARALFRQSQDITVKDITFDTFTSDAAGAADIKTRPAGVIFASVLGTKNVFENVTVTNSVLYGDNGLGILMGYGSGAYDNTYVTEYTFKDCTIKDCTIYSETERAAILGEFGRDGDVILTIENCTFEDNQLIATIDGTTTTSDLAVWYNHGAASIEKDGKFYTYEYISDAIEAAAEGGNVVLAKDVTLTEDEAASAQGKVPFVINGYTLTVPSGYVLAQNEDGTYSVAEFAPTYWKDLADTSWYNTTDNEFEITTAEQLAGLDVIVEGGETFEGKTVKLGADIDLASYVTDEANAWGVNALYWEAIGYGYGKAFRGTFDGQGHTISNLYSDKIFVNEKTDENFYKGLFGRASGNFQNLKMHNVHVFSCRYAAALIACGWDGHGDLNVKNIEITGNVIIETYRDAAVIVGSGTNTAMYFDNIKINVEEGSMVTNTMADKAYNENLGSVTGAANIKSMTNVESNIDIVALRGVRIGGIATIGKSTWENVTYTGDITTTGDRYETEKNGPLWMTVGLISGTQEASANYTNVKATGTLTYGDGTTSNGVDFYTDTNGHAAPANYFGSTSQVAITIVCDHVAEINGIGYKKLSEAVKAANAVTDGSTTTITLLTDLSDNVRVTINAGKSVVLDLGGHTWKSSGGMAGYGPLTNKGTLTIQNGTIISTTRGGNVGTVTNSGTLTVAADATLERIHASANITFYGIKNTAGTATVYGTIKSDGNGIYAAGTVNIEAGAKITSNGYGIDVLIGGTTTINGGEILGNTSAVQVTKGSLTINGGKFDVHGTAKEYLINCIDANYDAGTASVSVTGGEFVGFNPSNNITEGANTNYAPGYKGIENNGVWTVEKIIVGNSAYVTNNNGTVTIWGEATNADPNAELYMNILAADGTVMGKVVLNDVDGIYDATTSSLTWHAMVIGEEYDTYWTTIWNDGYPNGDAEPANVELYIDGQLVNTTAVQMSAPDGLNPVVWNQLFVAEVNGVVYGSLQAAIAAANAGDTVTLLTDVSVSETLTIDKAITLNLNDKAISYAEGVYLRYLLNVSGDATISGGSITTHAAKESTGASLYPAAVLITGNVTLDQVVVSGYQCVEVGAYDTWESPAAQGASLTLKDSTINTTNRGVITNTTGTVTISGSTLTGLEPVYMSQGNVVMNSGKLEATQISVATNSDCVFTLNGGEIIGSVAVYAGEFIMNGGSITSADEYPTIALCPYGYGEGGSFVMTAGSISNTGGGDIIDSNKASYTGTISGGSFNKKLLPGYIAEGYMLVSNGDGTYVVVVDNSVASVTAPDGTVTKYEDVTTALKAATGGNTAGDHTVTLLQDCTTGIITGFGAVQNVVLDLNGKTLTIPTYFYIANNDTLTIKDSSAEQTGKVLCTNWGGITVTAPNGKLILESGTVTHDDNFNAGSAPINQLGSGKVMINGGSVIADENHYAIDSGSSGVKGGIIEVNGGKVTGPVYFDGTSGVDTAAFNGGELDITLEVEEGYDGTITKAAELNIPAPEDCRWENNTTLVAIPYVAEVNGVKYESLNEAIRQAFHVYGDVTVNVLADGSMKYNHIRDAVDFYDPFDMSNITLNLNGHTVTVDGEVSVIYGDSLTITGNGNMVFTGSGALRATMTSNGTTGTKSAIVIENGTFTNNTDGTVIIVDANAMLTVNDGTFSSTENTPVIGIASSGVVTLNGGTYPAAALKVQGEPSVTKSNELSIPAPEGYVWENDTTLVRDVPKGEVSRGMYSTSNNRIQGAVMNANPKESVVLELYSGETKIATTTLTNADYLENAKSELTWSFCISDTSSSWDTAWEAYQPDSTMKPDKVVLYIDGVQVAENTVSLHKNNFDMVGDEAVWAELDGVHTWVAQIGEVKYESLSSAISDVQADETITLLADDALTSNLKLFKSFTLDLNGKTLDVGTSQIMVYNDLTVMGSGTVKGSADMIFQVVGKLTIEGDATYTNPYGVIYPNSGATVVLNGGTYPEGGISRYDVLDIENINVTKAESVTMATPNGYGWVNNKLALTAVAQILGRAELYSSLQDAIDAVMMPGQTVILLDTIDEDNIQVAAGTEVVIDLDGKTVDVDIMNYGKLTVKNGTINNTNAAKSAIENNGANAELVVEDLNITSVRHALRIDGGKAKIVSGSYVTVGQGTVFAVNISTAATVEIVDGIFKGAKETGTNEATAALKIRENSTVTIANGSFSGGVLGTLQCDDTSTISITGGSYDEDPTAYCADGYWAYQNYTGSIASCKDIFLVAAKAEAPKAVIETIEEPVEVTLNGKTYTLESAYTFSVPEDVNGAAAQYSTWHADFVVSVDQDIPANSIILAGSYAAYKDGEWVAYTNDQAIPANTEIRLLKDIGNGSMNYYELCEYVKEFSCGVTDINGALDGVEFTVELKMYQTAPITSANPSVNVEVEGVEPIVSNDVTFEIGSNRNYVAQVGSMKFETLQAAINVADGQTVTVLADFDENNIEVAAGTEVVIDLNGKTVDVDIMNYGKLTVKNGTINNTNAGASAIENNGADAMLTVEALDVTSMRHALRIDGGKAIIVSGSYVTVGQGTVFAVNVSTNAYVQIVDGTFKGAKETGTNEATGALKVRGGSLVNIANGNFSGGILGTLQCEDGIIAITGGVFDEDPTAYCTYGYWAFQKYNTKSLFFVEKKLDAPMAIIETIDNPTVTVDGIGEITLESTYSFTAPHKTAEEALASQYSTWHADFVVSVDQDIPANSIVLAGNYGSYGWVAYTNTEAIPAGTKIRLLKDIGNGSMNYYELCTLVQEFKCGVADINNALDGVNLTVELQMFQTEPYTDSNTTWNAEVENAEPIVSNAVTFEIGSNEMVEFAGTTLDVGNSLDINFYIKKATVNAELQANDGYYVQITRSYADGTADHIVKIPSSEWENHNYGWGITYDQIAGAQMCDLLNVQVFYANGTPASEVKVDGIREYVMRNFDKQKDTVKSLFADMLNYGAAAQEAFGYNVTDLANSQLSDAQQAYATHSVTMTDNRIAHELYAGSTLNLKSRIEMAVYFKGITAEKAATMYAKYTFEDLDGKEVVVDVAAGGLKNYSGNVWGVVLDELVIAYAGQLVEVTLYNADGSVYGTVTDSVESYIARMSNSDAMYEAILKFASSAKAYFGK